MRFFFRFLITSVVLFVLIQNGYLSGITLQNHLQSLLIFVFILGLMNLVLGGILRFITLPFRILTFGALGLFISFFIVFLTDYFLGQIQIDSTTSMLIIAVIMSTVSLILD